MLRSLASSLLGLVEGWLERSVSQAEVEAYLRSGAQKLVSALGNSEPASAVWKADGMLALQRATELGLVLNSPAEILGAAPVTPHDRGQIDKWRKTFLDRPPRWQVAVEPGMIGKLSVLLDDDPAAQDGDLHPVVESLLRHVELRRERALERIKAWGPEPFWLERHEAAILLAAATRRSHDPRYLNAAFKLNDYAWRAHRHFRLDPRHVKYLRSLAEAELALRKTTA
jgi:hypothetical protein